MISRFERFTYALFGVYRHWHSIAGKEMERFGLKGSYAVYLLVMRRNPEGITAAQLCEASGRDKSDVSRAVAAMEKLGFVKKEGVPYRALLKLTPQGLDAADQVQTRSNLAVELAGKDLTQQQRDSLYESLELIGANLQKLCETGLPKEQTERT